MAQGRSGAHAVVNPEEPLHPLVPQEISHVPFAQAFVQLLGHVGVELLPEDAPVTDEELLAETELLPDAELLTDTEVLLDAEMLLDAMSLPEDPSVADASDPELLPPAV